MLTRLRSRLTYANVMATIAVFGVLGGTAVAGIALTRGSVKTKHIARNAVTTKKVKNRTLRRTDFARGQLRAGPAGPPGATGPPGAPGATGPPGPAGSPAAGMVTGVIPNSETSEMANLRVTYAPSGVTASATAGLSPNATVVLSDLTVDVTTPPSGGAERRFRLGFGDHDQDADKIVCTIAGSEVACDTGDQTLTVPPESNIGLSVENGTTTPSAATVRFGYRAALP